MKKKILVGALLASAMVVNVYAYSGQNMMSSQSMQGQGMYGQSMMNSQGQSNCEHGIKGRMYRGGTHGRHSSMQMFSRLNLSGEQQYKLSILRDEMRLNMKKLIGFRHQNAMADFIGKNGFDKEAFEKYANEMHRKMLDIKANNMEKVFKILTKEQIIELKKNLEK